MAIAVSILYEVNPIELVMNQNILIDFASVQFNFIDFNIPKEDVMIVIVTNLKVDK